MDFVPGFVLLVFINLNLVFKSFKKSISVLLKWTLYLSSYQYRYILE